MPPKAIRVKEKSEKKKRPRPKTWYGRLWHEWIKPVGLVVLVVFAFRSTFVDWNDVPSASMEPTILVGDRIFVNKLAYGLQFPFSKFFGGPWWLATWGGPQHGDIVVFFSPQDDRRMVKRVLGVPGDTIEVRDNIVYINGKLLEHHDVSATRFERLDLDPQRDANGPVMPRYQKGLALFRMEKIDELLHPVMFIRRRNLQYADWGPMVIPPGKYLMMGDNRNNSRDSRDESLGLIPREQIVGRAFGVAFSFDKVPRWSIRWDRFVQGFDQMRTDE